MKNIRKISAFCIATILIMQLSFITVFAMKDNPYETEQNTQNAVNVDNNENIDELQPMMAAGCSYVRFSTSMANQVSISHGYTGAEDLKADFGFSSNGDMARDTKTGQIVIITSNGSIFETGLYGGW